MAILSASPSVFMEKGPQGRALHVELARLWNSGDEGFRRLPISIDLDTLVDLIGILRKETQRTSRAVMHRPTYMLVVCFPDDFGNRGLPFMWVF